MDVLETLRDVMKTLEAEGVPYMLVGGMALEALGMPRTTLDIDIQVLAPEDAPEHKSILYGCIVEEWAKDEVFGQQTLIGHTGLSGVPVEFFFTTHWFTRQALERRQAVRSESLGRDVPIPTPEDFVLLKACYLSSPGRRRTKAAQDALDVESVARAFALDETYVRANAERLGVWETLRPLLHPSA